MFTTRTRRQDRRFIPSLGGLEARLALSGSGVGTVSTYGVNVEAQVTLSGSTPNMIRPAGKHGNIIDVYTDDADPATPPPASPPVVTPAPAPAQVQVTIPTLARQYAGSSRA